MLARIWNALSYDIGIDLGTANTLVYVRGQGITIREPSIASTHKKTKQIIAIGHQAKKMLGKTPQTIQSVRPLRHGVISDFDVAQAIVRSLTQKVHATNTNKIIPKIPRPRIVVGVPHSSSEVERKAVLDACFGAGAREAYLIEESVAAAIGAGLNIDDTTGYCIVDIGGGTTEMAILSMAGPVASKSIKIAGDHFDAQILNTIKINYGILIGEKTAEDVKILLGSVARHRDGEFSLRGRDISTGLPKQITIRSIDLQPAIQPPILQIIHELTDLIEKTPPELIADILDQGICLSGGGALMHGLPELIADKVKMPVFVADDPLTCVVRGCAAVLEDKVLLEKVKVAGGTK